jgi:hypothetical protein
MANLRKWAAAPTSRGTVLTTELNSLGIAAFSSAGPALDNTANLDMYCDLELNLASLSPSAGAYVTVYMLVSNDGTNYEDAAAANNAAWQQQPIVVSVPAVTGTHKVTVPGFILPPKKVKFVLYNGCGVALPASGNTLTAYTYNETNNG